MAPVTTITNGRRQRKPRIRVVLDQQLSAAMQGDQAAIRTTATLLRAVGALSRSGEIGQPESKASVHNEQALARLLENYDKRVIEADQIQRGKGKKKEAQNDDNDDKD